MASCCSRKARSRRQKRRSTGPKNCSASRARQAIRFCNPSPALRARFAKGVLGRFHLVVDPRPRLHPPAPHGAVGNAKDIGGLAFIHPGKEAAIDNLGEVWVEFRQISQRVPQPGQPVRLQALRRLVNPDFACSYRSEHRVLMPKNGARAASIRICRIAVAGASQKMRLAFPRVAVFAISYRLR